MRMRFLEKYAEEEKLRMHFAAFALALLIPASLALCAAQANRHTKLRDELEGLEEIQASLVEKNRELISEISVLSGSERISKIAENELGMHKASKEEIVRVEILSSRSEK